MTRKFESPIKLENACPWSDIQRKSDKEVLDDGSIKHRVEFVDVDCETISDSTLDMKDGTLSALLSSGCTIPVGAVRNLFDLSDIADKEREIDSRLQPQLDYLIEHKDELKDVLAEHLIKL